MARLPYHHSPRGGAVEEFVLSEPNPQAFLGEWLREPTYVRQNLGDVWPLRGKRTEQAPKLGRNAREAGAPKSSEQLHAPRSSASGRDRLRVRMTRREAETTIRAINPHCATAGIGRTEMGEGTAPDPDPAVTDICMGFLRRPGLKAGPGPSPAGCLARHQHGAPATERLG